MANEEKKVLRRIRPGCSAEEFGRWSDQTIEDMNDIWAVRKHIQQTIKRDPTNVEAIFKNPEIQEDVWIFEHARQFCMELNELAVKFQEECTCKKMSSTMSFVFECTVHNPPKICTAVDYTRHTLDEATNFLMNRSVSPISESDRKASLEKLESICSRFYKILLHAYNHHRAMFDKFEKKTLFHKRIKYYIRKYSLEIADFIKR